MQILLVEDDNMLAEAIGFGLRQDHWEIERVADGVAALAAHSFPSGHSMASAVTWLPPAPVTSADSNPRFSLAQGPRCS